MKRWKGFQPHTRLVITLKMWGSQKAAEISFNASEVKPDQSKQTNKRVKIAGKTLEL